MKIAVILGSTREGRQTDKMAKWVFNILKEQPGVETELIDLKDYELPFFNEPVSPKFNPERKPVGVVKQWLDKLQSSDAFIIVTPEYNHSVPGVLKNALDFTDFQVSKKPFAIVSHGSAGGARAAAHLKAIISEIRAMVISTGLAFTHRVSESFDEQGRIKEEYKNPQQGPEATLKSLVDELMWYSQALKAARTSQ